MRGGGMRRGGMGRRRAGMRRRRMMRMRRRRRRRRRILLVGGLLAFGAYKMSKKDAQRIEEHTGTDPEEMTDEELEKAMDELKIEKQYRDDSDQEYVEDASAQEGQEAGQPSYIDELERLSKLKDEGVITEEDFENKMKQLLGL
jgi:hypothetical protein